MAISYKPLWITLAEKGLTKTELMKMCKLYPNTLSLMKYNQPVSLKTIERICLGLDCSISEVVEIFPEPKREIEWT